MVRYACLFICFFFILHINGQKTEICDNDTDFVTMSALDNLPCYNKGCRGISERDLLKFIQKTMNYPETARHDLIEGTVTISYLVELNGSTSQHKILKGIRDDIDKEALRICKLIKYAEPAKQANKPVRVKMVLPIIFSLNTARCRLTKNK
ncbi:MAG: energy transducer TonB [Paludibacter sp.]|nr:energy transducer TonB [Paludibacter sp.]